MPVNTPNQAYKDRIDQWQRSRDVSDGQDAIKEAGEKYLRKLKGQNDDDYENYKDRAYFFNGSQRTIDGLSGLIFRKEADVEIPKTMEGWMEAVTAGGLSLRELSEYVILELLKPGRIGLLTDFPVVDDPGNKSVAETEKDENRPYISTYTAESIINWRQTTRNGKLILELVVLQEISRQPKEDDEFVEEEIIRYRVLKLEDNQYTVEIFRQDGEDFISEGKTIPVQQGKPLDHIPFEFIGPEGKNVEPAKPPLLDLFNVNLAHYKNSASHEHGLHFTALPTPVITGQEVEEGTDIVLGSETAIVLDSPTAKAQFLEFSGTGLGGIETAMMAKKSDMAVLGARMLAEDKKAAETAEAAAIHRSGEGSILAKMAGSASKSLTRALQSMATWASIEADTVSVELNRDYLPKQMDPGMIKEMTALWLAEGIAHSDLFDNLKAGEVIAPNRDREEMLDEIETERPTVTSDDGAGDGDDGDGNDDGDGDANTE